MDGITRWNPLSIIEEGTKDERIVLILLNHTVHSYEKDLLLKIWDKAVFKAVTDGASNRLYHFMGDLRENYIPDLISGDFDSVEPDILQFYKSKVREVIETPDQDYTDFDKCLQLIIERRKLKQFDSIYVFGTFGGRLDQVFSNIHIAYKNAIELFTDKPIYLLGEGSLACVLGKGLHCIHVNSCLERNWCGLVPVGCSCGKVSTTGLKWNLDKQELNFGGLISTSNTFEGEGDVTVETSHPLLWTMGINLKHSN